MADTDFQDQAKGFADALLAHRTASIVEAARQAGAGAVVPARDTNVIKDAIKMLSSCEAGLLATEQPQQPAEMGFLEWMDSLKHYEAAFDAIVRARLADKEKDIAKALTRAKESLQRLLDGEVTGGLDQVVVFFESMSEISLEAAEDAVGNPPQELRRPEDLALGTV